MEKAEVEKKLKIPENASDRNDFVMGIGKKEIAVILISLFIAFIITISFIIANKNMLVGIFIAVFVCAATVLIVKRDAINESLIDKLKFIIRYYKIQKKYFYVQFDFLDYEGEKANDSK